MKRPSDENYPISVLALSLFVFWVFTDNSDATLSLNDFALFTNWFYRRSNLHYLSLLSQKSPLSILPPNELFGKNFFCDFLKFFLLINSREELVYFLTRTRSRYGRQPSLTKLEKTSLSEKVA